MKIALAAIKDDRTIVELAQQFDLHPNQSTQWKNPLLERAADAFDDGDLKAPAIDIKALHARIGALRLGNDFLESTHSKAGLPSAK